MTAMASVRINPTGELPEPLPIGAAAAALDKLQGYTPSEVDLRDAERQFPQLKGQFLVDRDGIVRWVNIEGAASDSGCSGSAAVAGPRLLAPKEIVGAPDHCE